MSGNLVEIHGRDLAHVGDYVPTDSGDLDTVEGLENLKQALFQRLITVPGSLAHRPRYGVGVKKFLNSINSIANQRELFILIQEQFPQDPRVESVTGVLFTTTDQEPSKTQILVRVKPVGYDEVPMNFVPFAEVV